MLDGSVSGLETNLNNDKFGNKIIYHLFIKNVVEENTTSLKMYEFIIDRNKIPVFYENNINPSKAYMGFIYVIPPPSNKAVSFEIPQPQQDDPRTPEDVKQLQQIQAKQANKLKNIEHSQVDWTQAKLRTLITPNKEEVKDSTRFNIPPTMWAKYATHPDGLFLDLSTDKYQKVLEKFVLMLNKNVIELFNNLQEFSTNITNYFTTENTNSGVKAYQNVLKLKTETNKAIK